MIGKYTYLLYTILYIIIYISKYICKNWYHLFINNFKRFVVIKWSGQYEKKCHIFVLNNIFYTKIK
jgi:hypothetical protein